jgi:hypothetical protein
VLQVGSGTGSASRGTCRALVGARGLGQEASASARGLDLDIICKIYVICKIVSEMFFPVICKIVNFFMKCSCDFEMYVLDLYYES